MGLKVLSLFDGISCAKVALERAGFAIDSYTAYEIDEKAIAISKRNHPSIQHKGSVKEMKEAIEIDLLIGGSPCQDLSINKADRKGLSGERSGLFWEYARIKELCQPKWFLLENVASMSQESKDIISKALGVEPVMFNASLVSAQRRKRYFWTNIPFTLPEDKKVLVKDILEPVVDSKYSVKQTFTANKDAKASLIGYIGAKPKGSSVSQGFRVYSIDGKSSSLSANGGGIGAKTGLYKTASTVRRLTPVECERLQGLPDGYTAGVSDTNRYKCCGNAFNVDVVCHIVTGVTGLGAEL
jgi:DNA (cytosine-5)-methyltransferase 3A